MSKPHLLSAQALVEAYRKRSLSPVEATRSCLDRIAALDGRLNAFCLVDEDSALADARASEARWMRGQPAGLVDGVPTSIKDLFLTKKWPTMRGSLTVSREQSCDVDAPPVARLREQGAVFLGKTTTTEFGHKGVGDSPLTGITRNPWNTDLTPGGSSCGAGVAAAAAMAPLNLGSDGGGSIRIPASFCGVFGIKPGYGRVPSAPAGTAGSLPANGPLTRTVADAALMLQVISGDDSRDWTSLPEPGLELLGQLESGVSGLRIAYARTIGTAPVTGEVDAAVATAAETFRSLGADVEEIALDLPGAVEAYYAILSVTLGTTLDGFTEAQRALVDPGLLILADDGRRLSAFDYARALHVARAAIGVAMRKLHERYDLLLLPSMPRTAFRVGEDFPGDTGGQWRADWTPFSFPFNLTCQPACSIPCGLSSDGLPIGLQIVGRVRDEALVLRAARAFETTRHFPSPNL
ncbi:amidase [Bosea lathyri]|uniref:Aspartyl-tRNA(Asn)/glutamyl-tRNA(Gln) amidotransferase subunit A n=1 Tax=Bosea lathyri TaxID=1036778 RepID=A0A1H6C8Z0_9HYPH|nr:amidase [Bosea lathyri]SEG69363.1 aspartyl-tRNA(Asn)/glutamyl-tRNA(Gln) amidotransferase subunit A [Bosea lathyri]